VSKRPRGAKQSRVFHRMVLDLVVVFEERAKAAGLSAGEVDAQIAATFIEILYEMVDKRETYSAEGLLSVFKEVLDEGAAYEQ